MSRTHTHMYSKSSWSSVWPSLRRCKCIPSSHFSWSQSWKTFGIHIASLAECIPVNLGTYIWFKEINKYKFWALIFATLALVLSLSTLAFTLSPGDLTVPSCFQGDTTWDQDNIYRSSNSPLWILQIKNLSCNVYSYSVLVDFDSPEKCQETCQADPACVGFTLVQSFTKNLFNHPVLNWLLNY